MGTHEPPVAHMAHGTQLQHFLALPIFFPKTTRLSLSFTATFNSIILHTRKLIFFQLSPTLRLQLSQRICPKILLSYHIYLYLAAAA